MSPDPHWFRPSAFPRFPPLHCVRGHIEYVEVQSAWFLWGGTWFLVRDRWYDPLPYCCCLHHNTRAKDARREIPTGHERSRSNSQTAKDTIDSTSDNPRPLSKRGVCCWYRGHPSGWEWSTCLEILARDWDPIDTGRGTLVQSIPFSGPRFCPMTRAPLVVCNPRACYSIANPLRWSIQRSGPIWGHCPRSICFWGRFVSHGFARNDRSVDEKIELPSTRSSPFSYLARRQWVRGVHGTSDRSLDRLGYTPVRAIVRTTEDGNHPRLLLPLALEWWVRINSPCPPSIRVP